MFYILEAGISLVQDFLTYIIQTTLWFYEYPATLFGSPASPYFTKVLYASSHLEKSLKILPNGEPNIENVIGWFLTRLGSKGIGLHKHCRYSKLLDGSGFKNTPVMPYFICEDGIYYDSKRIIERLDGNGKLIPYGYRGFIARLLQFYFDEWWQCAGGYHQRWYVNQTRSSINVTGDIQDFSYQITNKKIPIETLALRQIERLDYHLSKDDTSRKVLDRSFENTLTCLENIYQQQGSFTGTLTIADLSLFSWMEAQERYALDSSYMFRKHAPSVVKCWENFHNSPKDYNCENEFSAKVLQGFFQEILKTLFPLQDANEKAYEKEFQAGTRIFNEEGKVTFKCVIYGEEITPYIKSFQVKAWREIKQVWAQLNRQNQECVLNCISDNLMDNDVTQFREFLRF